MTISSEDRVAGPYNGNDVTFTFSFAFKVFETTDVIVVQTDDSGVETTLTEGVLNDYTVALNSDQDDSPGGTVTLSDPLPTDYLLTITSEVPDTQPVQLSNQGGFYPSVINDALDRLTILVQQVRREIDRAIKIPISDGDGVDVELGTAQNRALRYLSFDDNGDPTLSSALPSSYYYGGATSDPTTRPDGSASAAGDTYYNTSTGALKVYTGATWASFSVASIPTPDSYTGNGSQTAYTLSANPGNENATLVTIDGVVQHKSTYSVSGTTLTFSTAPPNGSAVEIVLLGVAVPMGTLGDAVVGTSNISDDAVTTSKIADDAVTSAKIAAGAVGASEIADGGVGTAELADASVTTAKLNAQVVNDATTVVPATGDYLLLADVSDSNKFKKGTIANTLALATGIPVTATPVALSSTVADIDVDFTTYSEYEIIVSMSACNGNMVLIASSNGGSSYASTTYRGNRISNTTVTSQTTALLTPVSSAVDTMLKITVMQASTSGGCYGISEAVSTDGSSNGMMQNCLILMGTSAAVNRLQLSVTTSWTGYYSVKPIAKR